MTAESKKEIDPFELFCWYYLGLSPQGEYKFVNGNQVAQLYNWSVDELMSTLRKLRIDPDTVVNTDFPMARHQIDVQMAAESNTAVSNNTEYLLELAERIFNDFRSRVGTPRDWLREIENEREEDRERRRK